MIGFGYMNMRKRHNLDNLDTTGKRIAFWMQNRPGGKMTQKELVVALEELEIYTSQSVISRLLDDKTAGDPRIIAGIAKTLKLSSDYLLLNTDDPNPKGEEEEDDLLQESDTPYTVEIQLSPAARELAQIYEQMDIEFRLIVDQMVQSLAGLNAAIRQRDEQLTRLASELIANLSDATANRSAGTLLQLLSLSFNGEDQQRLQHDATSQK